MDSQAACNLIENIRNLPNNPWPSDYIRIERLNTSGKGTQTNRPLRSLEQTTKSQ